MEHPAILAEGLGKRYLLGERASRDMRDAVGVALSRLAGRPAAAGRREALWALRDVSFEIAAGERVGIIGANGAGKSTLLKVISRITPPTTGRAQVRGRLGSLLEVGTGFHPELTGAENIFLNGALLGMRRREVRRKFDDIVEFAEVERFIDTPVKRYSDGMYVRLAFAIAAHLDLDVMAVDEVLAVGDSAFQRKCLGKIDAVASEGRTVVFVSHSMAAVSQVCTRAMLIEGGRVMEDGPARDVVQTYLQNVSSSQGERRWDDPSDAPGDAGMRLRRLAVLQAGKTTGLVALGEPLEVVVEFVATAPFQRCAPAIYLYDANGVVVLTSAPVPVASVADPSWLEARHEAGEYVARCRFPAELLNDGRYYLSAFFYDFAGGEVRAEAHQALAIDAFDLGENRVPTRATREGVVRVSLPWETSGPDHGGGALPLRDRSLPRSQ